ncbi:MAG: hypothetical protein PHV07_02955 [Oscillospiraceae bacterium]|nr:hypothetical protein [Oscillospiraceae bacterium]
MRKRDPYKVVISVEEFAKMSSSQVCDILVKNRNYCIQGNTPGVDRCIIEPDFVCWFIDNTTGERHTFKTLKRAVRAAKKQGGLNVPIYDNNSMIIEIVELIKLS